MKSGASGMTGWSSHQKHSSWQFELVSDPTAYQGTATETANYGAAQGSTPTFHVKITVHKGVLPMEPGHPDLWGNATRMIVGRGTFTNVLTSTSGVSVGGQNSCVVFRKAGR